MRFAQVAHSVNPASAHPIDHPFETGHIFYSPGVQFAYQVLGPCCRLFDREQLPWPSCRLEWRSKEPSWRRIGRRFIADIATRNHPSYAVEIIGRNARIEPLIITLYHIKLTPEQQEWWHSKIRAESSVLAEQL